MRIDSGPRFAGRNNHRRRRWLLPCLPVLSGEITILLFKSIKSAEGAGLYLCLWGEGMVGERGKEVRRSNDRHHQSFVHWTHQFPRPLYSTYSNSDRAFQDADQRSRWAWTFDGSPDLDAIMLPKIFPRLQASLYLTI